MGYPFWSAAVYFIHGALCVFSLVPRGIFHDLKQSVSVFPLIICIHLPSCTFPCVFFLAVIYRSWCETRLFSADTDINIWELKTTTSYWRIGFLFLGNTHLSLTALDTGPTGSETQSSHWTVSHVGRCPVNSWRACGADGLHLGGDVGGTVSMLHLCSCECSYWCQHVCWRECVCVCVLRRCYCRILAFLLWNNECFPMCVCVCVRGLVRGCTSWEHCCASFFWGPDGETVAPPKNSWHVQSKTKGWRKWV